MNLKIFLIFIIVFGLFFYSFRVSKTLVFNEDSARDALRILRLWQNKDITLIGPPISFTEHTTHEAYLGSLSLYIGMLGLLISHWAPIGAVLPNILLFSLSILIFYKSISYLTNEAGIIVFATILYALSPITVFYARFFWNPNLIIPVSVLFWFLAIKPAKSLKTSFFSYLFAGIVAGIMFNLHYLTLVPLLFFGLILIFKKQVYKFGVYFIGLILGCLPIIYFEVKNNFLLTRNIFIGFLANSSQVQLSLVEIGDKLLDVFLSIFGLVAIETKFPLGLEVQHNLLVILTITLLVILFVKHDKEKLNIFFWLPVVVASVITIYLSFGSLLRLRYLFSVYPILIYLISAYLNKIKPLNFLLFIPVISASTLILLNSASLDKNYLPLSKIEEISTKIINDDPTGNYNITENLGGDARSYSFRYFVEKDARNKPYNELKYYNLNTLYVISPNLDKIYSENRWEYYASGPWVLKETTDFGEVRLFRFEKI